MKCVHRRGEEGAQRRERRLSEAKDEGRDDAREGGKFGDTKRERERNVSISLLHAFSQPVVELRWVGYSRGESPGLMSRVFLRARGESSEFNFVYS